MSRKAGGVRKNSLADRGPIQGALRPSSGMRSKAGDRKGRPPALATEPTANRRSSVSNPVVKKNPPKQTRLSLQRPSTSDTPRGKTQLVARSDPNVVQFRKEHHDRFMQFMSMCKNGVESLAVELHDSDSPVAETTLASLLDMGADIGGKIAVIKKSKAELDRQQRTAPKPAAIKLTQHEVETLSAIEVAMDRPPQDMTNFLDGQIINLRRGQFAEFMKTKEADYNVRVAAREAREEADSVLRGEEEAREREKEALNRAREQYEVKRRQEAMEREGAALAVELAAEQDRARRLAALQREQAEEEAAAAREEEERARRLAELKAEEAAELAAEERRRVEEEEAELRRQKLEAFEAMEAAAEAALRAREEEEEEEMRRLSREAEEEALANMAAGDVYARPPAKSKSRDQPRRPSKLGVRQPPMKM